MSEQRRAVLFGGLAVAAGVSPAILALPAVVNCCLAQPAQRFLGWRVMTFGVRRDPIYSEVARLKTEKGLTRCRESCTKL